MISTIIPSFNRADSVEHALSSCLSQGAQTCEAIIVDDGSTDDTQAVLEQLEAKWGSDRVRWVRQENAGAPAARNRGLDLARGKYIQLLDSDDYLDPRKFEVQVEALERSGKPMAIGGYQNMHQEPDGMRGGDVIANDGDLWALAAQGQSCQTMSPLFRADFLSNLRFLEGLQRKQDMEFLFRCFLSAESYEYTPGVLSYWVHHPGQRISDSYDEGTPVYEMFKSAIEYWKSNKVTIPRHNWWMLRRNGLRCARGLMHRGHTARAREIALAALAVPCGSECAAGLSKVIAASVLPTRARRIVQAALSRRRGETNKSETVT